MYIYGAGLAGLIAANAFQRATILEAGKPGCTNHKALLRFRSSAVGDFLGIDFRKVRVHKGIFYQGKFVAPNIALSNMYSQKVIGKLADRSIWNLEPVDRYIAPEDLIEQLLERVQHRLYYDSQVDAEILANHIGSPIISTMPMGVLMDIVDSMEGMESVFKPIFKAEKIVVSRYRLPNADVFQTIYFPDPETNLYRASITKDLLIVESMQSQFPNDDEHLWMVCEAFGIQPDLEPIEKTHQGFGKIAPIEDAWRKQKIFELSHKYGIFSLGRFGTWRNILLDDVLNDINVVKKLISASSSAYDLNMQNSK